MKYEEIIESQGIKIPFDPNIITPKIERPMRNNRYEGGECKTLRSILKPGDRVLELGAGVGLCSSVAASVPGVDCVLSVEANPDLIPLIEETHKLNGVKNVKVLNGVVTAETVGELDFFLRRDFWASSMEPDSRAYVRKEVIKSYNIVELVEEFKPTVIVCDIEGGELGLFDDVDCSTVRQMVMELHPKVYGPEGMARMYGVLSSKGLRLADGNERDSTVQLLERSPDPVEPMEGSMMPARTYREWPMPSPRVLVATCMKDEGPYILEWLAWHKAIGVTDFIVYTNDCTDGTAALLNHLDDMGELRHIPNPALALNAQELQPRALDYTHYMREFSEVDYFISMDVDEFINVRTGEGHLDDLFAATGPFDALSMTELNHGSNGRKTFEAGWVTDLFPGHEPESPGNHRAQHGVKTIVRLSERVKKVRNHRPDFLQDAGPILWLNGSGQFISELADDDTANGLDCRGTYNLVSLEHYPLRSVESYLIKMSRGDVVVAKKQVSRAYWRKRNRSEHQSSTYKTQSALAREYYDQEFQPDMILMSLHEKCVDAHRKKARALQKDPHFIERRDWIMKEAWQELPEWADRDA